MERFFPERQERGSFEEWSPSVRLAWKLSPPRVLGQAECPAKFEVQGVRNGVGRASVGWQGKGGEELMPSAARGTGCRGSDTCQMGATGKWAVGGKRARGGTGTELCWRESPSAVEDKKKNETTTPLPPEESVCSPIRCLIGLRLRLFREWSRGA